MTTPRPQAETRPKEVEISFWLWITNLVLGLLGLVLLYTQRDQIRAEMINNLLAQDPTADRSVVESVAAAALVVGVVFVLLFVAAGLIFVFLMRGGRNWARIALAVLGGLLVLVSLTGLAGATGASAVTGLPQFLLLIGAIVTMFMPAANAWFRRSSERFKTS